MEPIPINRTATPLKEQIDFLIKREFVVTYYGYRKVLIYFFGWTLAVIVLSTQTHTDVLITLKAVLIFLTAIAWVVAIVIIVAILIKRQKRIRWRNTTIKSILSEDTQIHMEFDNEKLAFITNTHKTEIKWNYYKFYTEYKNSIFFIPHDNLYEAISFSPLEIGHNNFDNLREIAKSKLKPLDDENIR